MWHTTSTPSAISPAAMNPHSCETALTARTKLSMGGMRIVWAGTINKGRLAPPFDMHCPALFDAQRRVDQFLSVRNFLGALRVRALPGHFDPLVVFGGRQRDHLDLVLLQGLDHLVVQALGFLGEIRLGLLARLEERVLLAFVQAAEALLRHQHRLVHEPKRVFSPRREGFHLLAEPATTA